MKTDWILGQFLEDKEHIQFYIFSKFDVCFLVRILCVQWKIGYAIIVDASNWLVRIDQTQKSRLDTKN